MNVQFPAKPADGAERGKGRSAGVTAVLGPTNTGKTHYAIERMLGHPSGIIGLPLRLLAREVYGRVVDKVGAGAVALITGEEKIKPKNPRYWVATVEAMPRDLAVSFVAIDEIQLAADLDRGHVFTDRLLHRRGQDETLVIGASTMRRAVEQLLPGVTVVSRPRLSKLTYAGEKKLSRLPDRSAIVAFSAEEVYAIAELIRRQRGGAAVVMGALSPRTRNAQVAMFQNGDVDHLIATDAIGMGLNLDLDHVAFAGDRKFDGWHHRRLNPAEMGQIAGRAGRHLKDGTFGTTGRCPPLEQELIEALEDHRFDPVPILQWRNADLDYGSIEGLQASLDRFPTEPGLTRAPLGVDVMVLEIAARDPDVRRAAKTRADVARLWDVCQVPDYRKLSPSAHAELALTLFNFVVRAGRIPDPWFATQLAACDRTDGDIDTLSARIAQVRTLTYIANRPDWLGDPEHWQGVTRRLEDRLSDALHERLAQRFVDRRTSVLMRRLRENVMLEAEITAGGDVTVEGQHVGQLHGFRFTADPQAAGEAARALNAAAVKALSGEIEARAERFGAAVDESLTLANDGAVRWLGDPVAKIAAGDKPLAPRAHVLADEHLTGAALETVQRRLDLWLAQHVKKHLGPLLDLEAGTGFEGIARGIAFQVAEALGVLERARVADEMKTLDQASRAVLRKAGIRFGAYHIYLPALVKPAPRALASQLWTLRHGGAETTKAFDDVPHLASSGRTSFVADPHVPKALYRAAGFRVCGTRAVRVDILERLADLIRPAIAYRPGTTPGAPPPGSADNDGFVQTVQMTSLVGCSGEDFHSILRSLGYVLDHRAGPAITVPLRPAAPVEPLKPVAAPAAMAEVAAAPALVSPAELALDSLEHGIAFAAPAADTAAPTVDEAAAEAPGPEPTTSSDIGGAAEVPPAKEAPDLAREDEAPSRTAPDGETTTSDIGEAPEIPPAVEAESRASAPEAGEAATAEAGHDGIGPEGAAVTAELEDGAAAEVLDAAAGVSTPADAAGTPAVDAEHRPEPTDAAEPVLIEVWRPHRAQHHAGRRPERGGSPRPARARAMPAEGANGEGAAEPRPAEARDDRRGPFRPRGEPGRDRRPGSGNGGGRGRERDRPGGVGATPAAPARAPAAATEDGAPAARDDAGHRRREGGDAPAGGNPRFDPRRDRRGDRAEGGGARGERHEGGGPRHFSSSERPAPRERQPDPNSPFAKLMALKLELERKKEP